MKSVKMHEKDESNQVSVKKVKRFSWREPSKSEINGGTYIMYLIKHI